MVDPGVRAFTTWHTDPLALVGRKIAGRYRILCCLETGVASASCLAVDGTDEVRVKLVTGPETPDAVLRFEREIASLSRVHHPHVVGLRDHGRCTDTGLPYLVTDPVPGTTLKRHLRATGRCCEADFRDLAGQILDGMIEVHRQQIVHRNLKPSNVVLAPRPDGGLRVTLVDFDLSRRTAPGEPDLEPEGLVGSPMTIAPEQLRGEATDARADVYALGVMFHQMLTGKRPYAGRTPDAVLHQQETGAHVPMAEALGPDHGLPSALVRLVERCLSPRPADRPRDAAELRSELDRAFATPPSVSGRVRTGTVLGLAAVVVASLAYAAS